MSEHIVTLNGTVNDVLNLFPFVDDETKGMLYAAIRGQWDLDGPITVQARDTAQAEELIRLSKYAEKPIKTVTVRSNSRPGVLHTISFRGGMPISCSCESFKFSDTDPCRHIHEAIIRGIKPREEAPKDGA